MIYLLRLILVLIKIKKQNNLQIKVKINLKLKYFQIFCFKLVKDNNFPEKVFLNN